MPNVSPFPLPTPSLPCMDLSCSHSYRSCECTYGQKISSRSIETFWLVVPRLRGIIDRLYDSKTALVVHQPMLLVIVREHLLSPKPSDLNITQPSPLAIPFSIEYNPPSSSFMPKPQSARGGVQALQQEIQSFQCKPLRPLVRPWLAPLPVPRWQMRYAGGR